MRLGIVLDVRNPAAWRQPWSEPATLLSRCDELAYRDLELIANRLWPLLDDPAGHV